MLDSIFTYFFKCIWFVLVEIDNEEDKAFSLQIDIIFA